MVELVRFENDCDAIIWSFRENGHSSVQSMYKTISFRGIQPVYTRAVWHINVPPRIHIFLWLMVNNKTLMRTNLAKRQKLEDLRCLYYAESETVNHLFFYCCVPTTMWRHLSDIFYKDLGADFESVARWWISNNKNVVLNTCYAALMWCTWKLRNDLCFQEKKWRSEKDLLLRLIKTLKNWQALCKAANLLELDQVVESLTARLHQPLS